MLQRKYQLNTLYVSSIFIIAFALLSIIPFLRTSLGQPLFSGIETYYHLTYLGSSTFFYSLLDFFSLQTTQPIVLQGILILLGLGSLFLFFQIVKDYEKKDVLYFSLLLLVLTPSFLQVHTVVSPYSLLLFFTLLSFLLFKNESKWFYIPLFLVLLLDTIVGLFLFALLFFYYWFDSKERKLLFPFLVLIFGLTINRFMGFSIQPFIISIDHLFSFLSLHYGYSLIILILGIGGLLTLDYRKRAKPVRSIQLFILLLSLFYENTGVTTSLILWGKTFLFPYQKRMGNRLYRSIYHSTLFMHTYIFNKHFCQRTSSKFSL
jgi:hypothetical protein